MSGPKIPDPEVAEVLACVLRDGGAVDKTFRDWCEEFGYVGADCKNPADALEIYEVCVTLGRSARKVFTVQEIEALKQLAEEAGY